MRAVGWILVTRVRIQCSWRCVWRHPLRHPHFQAAEKEFVSEEFVTCKLPGGLKIGCPFRYCLDVRNSEVHQRWWARGYAELLNALC